MSFVEFRFLWFFLIVFIVYWAMHGNSARKVWLLICSYAFYAAWSWKFTFLVLGSTTVDTSLAKCWGGVKIRHGDASGSPSASASTSASSLSSNTSTFLSLRPRNFWRGSVYRRA